MSEDWGQPVVIRTGPAAIRHRRAGRRQGRARRLYAIFSDGHDAGDKPGDHADLSYDPFKDFTFITMIAKGLSLLMCAEDGPEPCRS